MIGDEGLLIVQFVGCGLPAIAETVGQGEGWRHTPSVLREELVHAKSCFGNQGSAQGLGIEAAVSHRQDAHVVNQPERCCVETIPPLYVGRKKTIGKNHAAARGWPVG